MHRRSSFSRRVFRPAVDGNPHHHVAPVIAGMHFHDLRVEFAAAPNGEDGTTFRPYLRDPATLARPWAIPGTPSGRR